MRSFARAGWPGVAVVALVVASGCAVVEDHNANFAPTKQAMMDGRFAEALEAEDMVKGRGNDLDGLCYQLDSGVLAHLNGDYKRSIDEFKKADNTMGFHEDRGVTVGSVTEQTGSMLLNEKTIPYKGEGFEKILVSAYQAKNYLFGTDDVNEAMIEVRACYEKQKFVKQQYEKELDEAEEKKKDPDVAKGCDFNEAYKKASAGASYPAVNTPESIYQLCYVEYLSMIVAERKGEYQEAKISAQKCIEIRPDLKFLQLDLARTARMAGSMDTAQEAEKKYGIKAPDAKAGSVAVLFEHGMAPHKEEFSIVFPIRTGIGKFALPIYHTSRSCTCGGELHRSHGENAGAAVVLHVGDHKCRSAILTDLEAVAFRYHKDRMPLLITKAIIRTVLKVAAAEGTHEGVKRGVGGQAGAIAGFGAGLAVSIAGAATEQADLRAWLSLPTDFQAARVYCPQGEYPARLELVDAGGSVLATADLGTIKVKSGTVRFLDARSIGTRLYTHGRHEAWDDKPMGGPPKPESVTTPLARPDGPPAKAGGGDAPKPKPKPAPESVTKPLAKPDAPKPTPKPAPEAKTEDAAKADAPKPTPTPSPAPDAKTDDAAKADAPKKDEGKKDEPKEEKKDEAKKDKDSDKEAPDPLAPKKGDDKKDKDE